jgi:hypothetical protein
VYRDYGPQGVKFYFIYKSLAHPELEGSYVQPFTLEERLAHARQAGKQLGATIPWLVDPIDNRLKHALGDRPNSEFVIDPQGTIVRKRAWSDPLAVRKDLEELVGAVEKITNPEDLSLPVQPPLPDAAPKGGLPRVPRAGMFPLVFQPQIEPSGAPFFAKLRVEADMAVLDQGNGQLYVGFHLDPFHQAHWNNLYKPLRWEIEPADGVNLAQTTAAAPRVAAASDSDPREFLVDVHAWPKDQTIRLTVTYSACTGEVCNVVRQSYVIRRERDKDGGGARGAGFRGFSREAMLQRLLESDRDGDGKLVRTELDSLLQGWFADADHNQDGFLDSEEIHKMSQQMTARIE